MRVRGKNKVKHKRVQGRSLKGQFPLEFGLDTMLDCIELTKETIQYKGVLYIVWSRL